MQYNPSQFSSPTPPSDPGITIGGGAVTIPWKNNWGTPSDRPKMLPNTPGNGSGPVAGPQINPYRGATGNGYRHESGWFKGRQVTDRPNPVTRINGEPVPLPPHALQGNIPRIPPGPPQPGRGGTSMDNPNPGVGSTNAGAPTLRAGGAGSGKLASPTTGLRGI